MATVKNPIIQPVMRGDASRTLLDADVANELIATLNALQNMAVTFNRRSLSQVTISGGTATLNINPRDINLGTISGSRDNNAALASTITAIASAFSVTNSTTA